MPTAFPGRSPAIDLLLPAFDEEDALAANLAELRARLAEDQGRRWRILIVDDGSSDRTAEIAGEFARHDGATTVLRHARNLGLGAALRTGFQGARGDAVVTLDADLSYAPEVAVRLADRLFAAGADLVVASPYGPGGSVEGVPALRLALSRGANRLLAASLRGLLTTPTSLARACSRRAVETIRFSASGMDANLEIVAAALRLGLTLGEISAPLAWRGDATERARRSSWRSLARQAGRVLLWSFRLRGAAAAARRRAENPRPVPPTVELGA